MSDTNERTYIMIKPDGVQRGLSGAIVKRFEHKGFKLCALKLATPTKAHLEEHYADLKSKKFFPGLIEYMASGSVVCMVWEGAGVVAAGRVLLGATKPSDSDMGTIRGDFCIDVGRNICHGSDSVASAKHEIGLWFPEGVCEWESHSAGQIYENVTPKPAAAKAPAAAAANAPAAGGAKTNMEGNFGMEALCGMFEELNLPSVKTVAHAPCPTCELHTETLAGTEIDPVADTSLIQAKNLFFKVMADSPATL